MEILLRIPWWDIGVSLIIIVCGWNYWRDAKRDED